MNLININKLNNDLDQLRILYQSKKPFRYITIEDFFYKEKAKEIHESYPTITDGKWDGTTYLDQKNKFQKTKFEEGSIFKQVFDELNGEEFLNWLNSLTDMELPLIADDELFGGGLHQSINGAYLNVHIDYNIHPKTKYHRRLNVLVYMNEKWEENWGGNLELWDFTNDKKELLEKITPNWNKCVIFETNQISYHGHPQAVDVPYEINRKSIATYYYTEDRPDHEKATAHNTIYKNTEGIKGSVKRFFSGIKAAKERFLG
ncbi:2OG-Fe(II) oxygenase [Marivirga sp. S37H4]|uniref:2OG-Fe(II) oxygenase n=1 Tax=Marivirga aurantiaca TaxID=2802615 RepID=A0A934X217_9BACT|nr:2OG-Fe(II) oxygenase [Marivirga aurantiaca]MBK6267007.1 2OG-Fe(II) oxygenase [Marivirga aurantiaca]